MTLLPLCLSVLTDREEDLLKTLHDRHLDALQSVALSYTNGNVTQAEDLLQESMMKKATLESEQMSVQSMIGILSSFDIIYDRMNAAERRDLVKYLISEVELFPREEQKTQKRFVKAIAYKFPIEQKVLTQFDECGASVETVCLLSKLKSTQHIEVELDMDELDL